MTTTYPYSGARPHPGRQAGALHLRRGELRGLRGRYGRLGVAGERRASDGPRLQVSPAARRADRRVGRTQRPDRDQPRTGPLRAEHPRDGAGNPFRADRREPEQVAVAEVRSRRDQRPALHAVLGRLLLQDLHVAEVVLGQGLRAVHPQRRGARSGAGRDRSGPLRQPLPALRGADRRCRSRGTCGGADRRAERGGRGACRREPGSGGDAPVGAVGGDRRGRGLGLAGRCPRRARCDGERADPDPDHGDRLLSSEHDRALPEADRPSGESSGGGAAGADVAGAGR